MRTSIGFLSGLLISCSLLLAADSSPVVDRFGGDPRLKSTLNPGTMLEGKAAQVRAHSLTAASSNFPGALLAGKLVNPHCGSSESSKRPEKWFRIVSSSANALVTDPSDGDMTTVAQPGDTYCVSGVFTLEQIRGRWWYIDPEGNAFFPKAVSKTDLRPVYSQQDGNFQKYDAVYLERAGANASANLSDKAEDPAPADVVDASGATVRARGDALYIGSLKPFNTTYFHLGKAGKGGRMQWYYSVRDGWKLLNGSGNAASGAAVQPDGSYALDTGGYLGPKPATGELAQGDLKANLLHWWGRESVFPSDFAPVALPSDPLPKYYIKGVVTKPFSKSPALDQVYNTPAPYELLWIKYAAPGGDPTTNWLRAINRRYREWGWNMAGQYSALYTDNAGMLPSERMPSEPTVPLSGLAMTKDGPWHIKNVYGGATCPPGSGKLMYQGKNPDVFDPAYRTAVNQLATAQVSSNPWTLHWIIEEADELFGLDSDRHAHMGYVILSQNPYQPAADGVSVNDRKLYSKYALRDFLRYRYRPIGEALAPFSIDSPVPAYIYVAVPSSAEQQSLKALNDAWGTAYTTWDTSHGDLERGTNAWGSGSGFLDENGKSVFPGDCDNISYQNFRVPGHPQVKTDLDDFVAFFTQKYGSVIYPAVKLRTANLVTIPIYSPPPSVTGAIGPYTDALWTSFGSAGAERAKQVYDGVRKPLLVADYTTGDHDSPLDFGGAITALSYNRKTGRTFVQFSGRPYRLAVLRAVEFPGLAAGACADLSLNPSPVKAVWNSLEIEGDYTRCLSPGERIRMQGTADEAQTQAERAKKMTARMDAFVKAKGDDGVHFVAGWEHWSYMDHPRLDFSESTNFGLVTSMDNAYDGREARREVTTDANGRLVGGEDTDYGNLIGGLAPFLRGIYDRLLGPAEVQDSQPQQEHARIRGRVTDAVTGEVMPCTVTIRSADGQIITEHPDFRAGFRSNGIFDKTLPPGRTIITVRRGFDYGAEKRTLDLRPGETIDLSFSIRRRTPVRELGWVCGDNHVHMIHGQRTISTDFPHVALAGRAEALDYLSVAQLWNLPEQTPEAAERAVRAVTTPDLQLFWNIEVPKNYWQGDVSQCMGHGWTLGMRGYTKDGKSAVEELGAMSAHDYEREKVPTPNFDSHALIHELGGIVSYTHPLRWWSGAWGGQNGFPVEENKFVSNMGQELPFDTVAGPTYDTMDILMQTHEREANEATQRLWFELLNHGYRIPGTASTDATFDNPGGGIPGRVRVYTHIEGKLTAENVAANMKAGRNFVTSGPLLLLQMGDSQVGDLVRLSGPAKIRVSLRAWPSGDAGEKLTTVELIRNGVVINTFPVPGPGQEFSTEFEVTESGTAWYIARCLGSGPDQIAITNPIYFEGRDYRAPEPAKARVVMEVVDDATGRPLNASCEVLHMVGRTPLVESQSSVRKGRSVLTVPATARLRVSAPGHKPVTRSIFVDTPALLNMALEMRPERLVEWGTFEKIRALLSDVHFEFRLPKQN